MLLILFVFLSYEEELPSPSSTPAPVPESSCSTPTASVPSMESVPAVPLSESSSAIAAAVPVSLTETIGSSCSSIENSVAILAPPSDKLDDEAVETDASVNPHGKVFKTGFGHAGKSCPDSQQG